ncbi:MAG: efflux RND transporter permease subunit [Phycisphaerae bacterium]|nr:efflux RND transporter permease subunit [Phycisphaerae bacterium]
MRSNRTIIGPLVRNPVFANLLSVAMIAGGVYACFQLPRETFPETATDHILITVPYPGSSPQDAEQRVCLKIEQAIEGLSGAGEVSSLSEEDSCKVLIEVLPRVRPVAEVMREIEDRVNAIRTFPQEAERPIITELVIRNQVASVGVSGDVPEETIKEIAEQIRRDLLAHRKITQVGLSGVRDYEISVRLSEAALERYGMALRDVTAAIAQGSLDLPAGVIRTEQEEISIRTVGERRSAQEFEDLVVLSRPDGTTVRLGQIAEVRDTFEEEPVFGRVNGKPGAMVNVLKTPSEDISEIARVVRAYIEQIRPTLPKGVTLTLWADMSRDVDQRLDMLVGNGVQGVILLMICLLLFMDMRAAFGVAMGIPVATGGALWFLYATGQTLNMISLFGLIMADAIVLDDSIVIAENILSREKQGLDPETAAIEGTEEVGSPVFNASLTTIVMFLPLMFVAGVMGKLIYVLPVAVIATIVASAIEAFFVLPSHMAEWSTKHKKGKLPSWRVQVRRRMNDYVEGVIRKIYSPLINRLAHYRLVVLGAAMALLCLCAGLVLGGRTPFVLFPAVDGNSLQARVRLPEGVPVSLARDVVERLEQAALSLNEDPALRPEAEGHLIANTYSLVGEFSDFVPVRGSGLAEVNIELMPAELRRVDSADIIEHWRKAVGEIPDALSFSITRQELGPNEKPLEIRLLGDDLGQLRIAADAVEERLGEFAGVFDITDDLVPGKRELQVSLKPQAAALGLTVADLAGQLRQAVYGGEAVRLQRGYEEVKVMVGYAEEDRRGMAALDSLRVRTPAGGEVPFAEVADTHLTRGYSAIGRQDGTRRVRIQADVDERFANAEQIIGTLTASFLPDIEKRFTGVAYQIEGQRARIEESLWSLSGATIVALIITYAILGAVLRSYTQPLILFAAIPLGMAGAVIGHAVMGYDLSLMSVFGMTALAGIVVNDGLVLLDKLNRNVAEGMKIEAAVTDAAESRVLSVFLTALTNVAGVAPLLLERSTQAQPLIPIAISVAFGLTFSTALVLLVVPSLYFTLNDVKRLLRWLRTGGALPSPEEVEMGAAAHGQVEGATA